MHPLKDLLGGLTRAYLIISRFSGAPRLIIYLATTTLNVKFTLRKVDFTSQWM